MKRAKMILGGALAFFGLFLINKNVRFTCKSQPNEYQADDYYVPDTLSIHHWLS